MPDVRLAITNWIRLKQRPLFFVPDALRVYDRCGFSIAGLADMAKEVFADAPTDKRLGRGSIDNILRLSPVTEPTARRFVTVLNAAVDREGCGEAAGGPIVDDQIIAAVFRLRDARAAMDQLELSDGDVAERAGVGARLVENARRGGRVHYVAAEKLRTALQDVARERGLDAANGFGARLFGAPEKSILEDLEQPLAILKDERGDCLIRDGDLDAAPRAGHPWAIDRPGAG